MPKTYKLSASDSADDQKTITISEDITETKGEKTTVAQLKEEHARIISNIGDLADKADGIIVKLEGIEINIPEIAIGNIPIRIKDGNATKTVIKGGKP